MQDAHRHARTLGRAHEPEEPVAPRAMLVYRSNLGVLDEELPVVPTGPHGVPVGVDAPKDAPAHGFDLLVEHARVGNAVHEVKLHLIFVDGPV